MVFVVFIPWGSYPLTTDSIMVRGYGPRREDREFNPRLSNFFLVKFVSCSCSCSFLLKYAILTWHLHVIFPLSWYTCRNIFSSGEGRECWILTVHDGGLGAIFLLCPSRHSQSSLLLCRSTAATYVEDPQGHLSWPALWCKWQRALQSSSFLCSWQAVLMCLMGTDWLMWFGPFWVEQCDPPSSVAWRK